MKKVLFGVLIVMLLLAMAIPAFAAPAEKVDVCHANRSGSYNLISISAKAWGAHEAHGDAHPFEAVPDMPGYEFNASCEPVEIGGCFAGNVGLVSFVENPDRFCIK